MIRPADAARDGNDCAVIYAPYVRDTAISFEAQAPSGAEMSRRIAAVCAHYPWLVAERDGSVVGYAYACRHRDRAAYRWAADVSVYVDHRHHRHGLGRALYLELFGVLRERGVFIACAGVTLPNPASVGLHESLGFQSVGVYRSIGWKAGAWWDVGWWQLQLRPTGENPPPEPDLGGGA